MSIQTATSNGDAELPAPADGDFAGRAEYGREARRRTPRSAHEGWAPPPDRADPVTLIEEQATTRVPELVPIRHARMMVSPFTFYRGAALLMAADLAGTQVSGITTQICGDAHLSNFGVFGTPERTLVFDMNDFDETLPGPWEWDVKRLAASFEVAGRSRGFTDEERREINLTVVRGYRERMLRAAESRVLDAWYDRLDADQLMEYATAGQESKRSADKLTKRADAALAKARTKDSTRAVAKLTEVVDGQLRIAADPPLIVPIEQLDPIGRTREQEEDWMREVLASYQSTLQQQNHPMREFTYVHLARKVVGVGSVGTRAWIVLVRGRDDADPLLLQAKQAEASVLERFLPASEYDNHGERVVRGQRLMQAASDIFLGWHRQAGFDGVDRDFYIRQLHDWKGSADVDTMNTKVATLYARVCGETLARAHARAGDRVAIAAYLGRSDRFDR
ncbi:MAG TPA: DUF2252 domain-containing protein, partial [Actinomycetota bacterium]